ncbi:MAG: alpha-L-fucosidase [Kiritimatiellia bacterium]
MEEYEQLANQFNPVKFDAGEWAQLAQDAGMKYLVFVAKHHDGFAMFDSKADPYNIVNRTPWKRDPVRELSEACRRRGLTFCVYYSHNLDWHDPHATASRDLGPGSERDFSRHMNDKALPQIRELLTQYGPMGLVWFDMSGGMKREQAQPFCRPRPIPPARLPHQQPRQQGAGHVRLCFQGRPFHSRHGAAGRLGDAGHHERHLGLQEGRPQLEERGEDRLRPGRHRPKVATTCSPTSAPPRKG